MVEILPRFTFPISWNRRREPARPPDLRVGDWDSLYDYDSVWNDAVQINPSTILLIGPPLYGTAAWLRTACSFVDDKNRTLEWQHREMDRACVTVIKANGWTDWIDLQTHASSDRMAVNRPSMDFHGLKVIVTISKDHPIPWLKQWIDYHRIVHGVKGLLLYNNRSTIYDSAELESQLWRDDMVIKVVDYDVPFGVMGAGIWEWNGRSGTSLPWDSDFSQYVMLEHAKWRYLHCARLAINADTDELLYIRGATMDNLADYCESNDDSVWLYNGTWVEPIDSVTGQIASSIPFDQRRFENYWHTAHSEQRGIGVKWMLNPAKNMGYQWHLHKTFGPNKFTEFIGFGHYLAMNTSWSWKRDEFSGDASSLVELPEIKENLRIWKNNRETVA